MVVLKGLLYALIGFFGGGLAGLVVTTVLAVIARLLFGTETPWSRTWDAIHPITGPLCVLGGAALGFAYSLKEDADKKSAAEAATKAATVAATAAEADRRRQELDRQEGYRKKMVDLGNQSLELFELMPKYLRSAEEELDQAEVEFTKGYFTPFWEAIERAAQKLGCFESEIRHINGNLENYSHLTKIYEGMPPEFPLARDSVEKLNVSEASAERMKSIVRKSQGSYEFTMVYEQRKTNMILNTGFKNLAHALDQMTTHISASIGDLTSSVETMSGAVNKSMRTIHESIDGIAQAEALHRKERSQKADEGAERDKERAVREKKVVEMLDNIQRKRKPHL